VYPLTKALWSMYDRDGFLACFSFIVGNIGSKHGQLSTNASAVSCNHWDLAEPNLSVLRRRT
jgi:hypothetical protein